MKRPPSATQQNITRALQVLSTPDNYDALALLVSKLELTVGSLQNEIKTLAETCEEEMDAHKKAIVALGDVIKGMDDRIEDIEHVVDFQDR